MRPIVWQDVDRRVGDVEGVLAAAASPVCALAPPTPIAPPHRTPQTHLSRHLRPLQRVRARRHRLRCCPLRAVAVPHAPPPVRVRSTPWWVVHRVPAVSQHARRLAQRTEPDA